MWHTYVYCRSGNRSKKASQKLVDLGYTNVIEFGGIIDYSGETEKGRQQLCVHDFPADKAIENMVG